MGIATAFLVGGAMATSAESLHSYFDLITGVAFVVTRACHVVTLSALPRVLIITQGSEEPSEGPVSKNCEPLQAPKITKNPLKDRYAVTVLTKTQMSKALHP